MIIHSIKWRLQAWHGFLLVTLVTGLMFGFYVFERRVRLQAIDASLHETVTPLLPRLTPPRMRGPEGLPDGLRRRPPPPEDMDGDQRFPEGMPEDRQMESRMRDLRPFDSGKFYYLLFSQEGRQISTSTNAPKGVPLPEFRPGVDKGSMRTRGIYRELAHIVPNGSLVVIGTSLAATLADLRHLAIALMVIGCSIVVFGVAVGWWLASRALKPIAEISSTAQEIAAGDLTKRINSSETESELGQLVGVLNSTFARLEAAFEQQKQFTSDAAHELRTPVAAMLTQTQSTLNRERTSAEYRETLEACERSAQRMRRLIESLLELARLDAGQEQMKRLPFDLADVTRDCVEAMRPLADLKQIKIHLDLFSATVRGDSERVAQVITNLLANAVNHSKDGGEIRIATRNGGSGVSLVITDTGSGISPAHLPHIFKRFYRADAARTSSQGRSGLGLAISKAIIDAHGGSIGAESKPDEATSFTVRLPAA